MSTRLSSAVHQRIVGYHTDEEGHWVAVLACGHGQHVRHNPPVTLRPWVLTPEGRRAHLGLELGCVRCAEVGLRVATAVRAACKSALAQAFEDVGTGVPCVEGCREVAVEAVDVVDLAPVVASALRG